ncbi:MAG: 3-isopropylmalate dehydratase large subunit [Deltaproteobacteria bacterium]|nr:3-isopropylmalate dehydratase large subunit [Deltaproteobacteria bacterium]
MGMTISQKILAAHAGKKEVAPGELVTARVDVALGNDITAPIAIDKFYEAGAKKVFDPSRVVLVPDHFTPNKDILSAMQVKKVREFAKEQGLVHWYEGGRCGVEHVLLPEKGIVVSGDLVIGADSHTCTYGALGAFATGVGSTDLAAAMATGEVWLKVPETLRLVFSGELPEWVEGKDLILHAIGEIGVDGALYMAMEFCGDAVDSLSMAGRFTMANMAIEAGGKAGMFAPDEKTREYEAGRALREPVYLESDPDAEYARTVEYDVSKLEPVVAFPHLPENVRPVSRAGDVVIDQAVIGSCTNGRIEDLRTAAKVLSGRSVHPNVRCIVLPATPAVYRQALAEGLLETFVDAGAVVGPPTCGPCLGGHMGILAEGERAVATTNRNFVGRMGHPQSEVYLANPAVAAASAVAGRIVSPRDL